MFEKFELIGKTRKHLIYKEANCLHIYDALTSSRLATYSTELLSVLDLDDMIQEAIR